MVLLQAIPFFLTVLGLNFIVFRPALELLAQREEHVDGFKRRAQELEKDTGRRAVELEARLQEARNRAGAERARFRAEAIRGEAAILDEARKRMEIELGDTRIRLAADREVARGQIRALARELSQRAASAILGRPVSD